MKIEVLSFEGCPNKRKALERVHAALREARIERAEVTEIEVDSPERARALRFLGSPTVRVNGEDVEPDASSSLDFGLMCRTYQTESNVDGAPPTSLIARALHSQT